MLENIAALDDSMVNSNGIYVYSHALIVVEQLPAVKIFSGKKEGLYAHEEELIAFIQENLEEGCKLYACNHYARYKKLWEMVHFQVNGERLPRNVRLLFAEVHNTAKYSAKAELCKLI